MLTAETKRKIDYLRDVLVGKIPVPSQQIEQITIGLIYKFMSDIDEQNEELGGQSFFSGEYKKYSWKNIMDRSLAGYERVLLYAEGLEKMSRNDKLPQLFRDIFKGAFLPFKDPVVLDLFLKGINEFKYEHSEELGDAFEYLLSTAASQGDAGQFRTPRHIIDFIVEAVDPQKEDRILDPACGTAGFLVFAYQHILKNNMDKKSGKPGSLLTSTERKKLTQNIVGYDISPEMVRLSLVNLYLHGFAEPNIYEYDTLSSLERWDDSFDCLLANPPFMTPRGGIKPHNRFPIQSKRSEVLFVDYIIEHLTPNGKAGIIVPEGIIFQSGSAYKQLRKMLVEDGLWAVISLPQGVFNPYSGVKTSILFFSKPIARQTKEILFVRVENDGFDLGAQRRPIDKNDLPKALEVIKKYKQAVQQGKKFSLNKDEMKFASVVKKEKIAEDGEYNLSANRYAGSERGIELNGAWKFVKLGEICEFIGKGKRPASFASDNGNVPFIASSPTRKKCAVADYNMEAIIIGDGGSANIHYVNGQFSASDHTYILKNKDNESLSLKFVYQMIANNLAVIEKGFRGVGLKNVSKKYLQSIQIPLPPIEVQQQIVAELDGYQKIIDGAKQIVENYKPTIKIDPKWKMVKLKEVCRYEGGTQPSKSTFITEPRKGYIRLLQIRDYKSDKNAVYIPITERHKTCSVEDIMIGRYGPPVFQILRGKSGAYNVALMKCVPNAKKITNDWLFYFLSSEPVQKHIIALSMRVRQAGVRPDELDRLDIPLPSLEIQRSIIKQIEEERKIIEANKELIKLFEQKIKDKISNLWGK